MNNKQKKFQLPFAFAAIDIETTDISAEKGSIIQIGAVLLTNELRVLGTFDSYVKPLDKYRNPEAMKVNGIDEETLQMADVLPAVLNRFEKFAKDVQVLAAWGAYFDVPFLKKQYEKIERDWLFGYRTLDLKSIAIWQMACRGQQISSGVERFLKALDMDFKGETHDARADILNTLRILEKLR